MNKRNNLLIALLIPLLIPGCSRIHVHQEQIDIQKQTHLRTGMDINWDYPTKTYLINNNNTEDPLGLTIHQSVEIALKNNPELHAHFETLGIAKSDLIQAGLYKNPQLNTAFNLPKQDSAAEIHIGLFLSASDAWQLPARKEVEYQQLKSVTYDIINAILHTIAKTQHAFNKCLYANEALHIVRTIFYETESLLSQLTYRQQFGMQNDLDINFAHAALKKRLAHVAVHEKKQIQAFSDLKAVMGQEPTASIIPLDGTIYTFPSDVPTDEDLLAITLRHPKILIVEHSVQKFENLITLEQRRFIRDLEVGFTYRQDYDGSKGRGPAINIQVPFFDQNKAQIARANFELKRSQKELCAVRLHMHNELTKEYANFQYTYQTIDALKNAIEAHKDAITYAYNYFNSMLISLPTLIDARLRMLDTELNLLESYYELNNSYVMLQFIAGKQFHTTQT